MALGSTIVLFLMKINQETISLKWNFNLHSILRLLNTKSVRNKGLHSKITITHNTVIYYTVSALVPTHK